MTVGAGEWPCSTSFYFVILRESIAIEAWTRVVLLPWKGAEVSAESVRKGIQGVERLWDRFPEATRAVRTGLRSLRPDSR